MDRKYLPEDDGNIDYNYKKYSTIKLLHANTNEVEEVKLDDYVTCVVSAEMPVNFELEALKAQAVAARNYVLTPRTQAYEEFSVVDSVASQVYFGVNTEENLATTAVMETDGIVALYDKELILALYSSTAGGYTENYSYAFSDPSTKVFPSESKDYLVAVPDKESFEVLEEEEKAREFATLHNWNYYETSANENIGIEELFKEIKTPIEKLTSSKKFTQDVLSTKSISPT